MKAIQTRAIHAGSWPSGVSDGLILFSIGLESPDDLSDDRVLALDSAAVAPTDRHAAAPAGSRP